MDSRIALLSGAAFLGIVGVGLVAAQRGDGPGGGENTSKIQAPVTGAGDVLAATTRSGHDDDDDEDGDEDERHESREHDEHEDDD